MTTEQATHLRSLIIEVQKTAYKAGNGLAYYSAWIAATNALENYIVSITQ